MLYMEFEGVPPTTNTAYYNQIVQGKKNKRLMSVRTLTAEGRAYKTTITSTVARKYGQEAARITPNEGYAIAIQVWFPNLLNSGYPKAAKYKFRKLDADGRMKLLIDSIADALAIDDSNFVRNEITKSQGPEKTAVWIWRYDDY